MSEAEQSDLMRVVGALNSLQDLELLLVLIEDRERWWDARAIAKQTGDSSSSTGRALDRLAGQNLLDIRVTDDVRFRYRPGTVELEKAGAALLDAYRRNPLTIIKLVAASRPRSAADFADAFRMRRDDDR